MGCGDAVTAAALRGAPSPLDLRPDPIEVGLHVLLPFGHTPRDDPRLFLRLRGDPEGQPRRSRSHPGPLANQHTVTGRFHLETPGGPDTVRPDDVPYPAALILHLDDLAYRLPFAECVVLAAAAKASTDPDAVRTSSHSADCSSAEHLTGRVMSVTYAHAVGTSQRTRCVTSIVG